MIGSSGFVLFGLRSLLAMKRSLINVIIIIIIIIIIVIIIIVIIIIIINIIIINKANNKILFTINFT